MPPTKHIQRRHPGRPAAAPGGQPSAPSHDSQPNPTHQQFTGQPTLGDTPATIVVKRYGPRSKGNFTATCTFSLFYSHSLSFVSDRSFPACISQRNPFFLFTIF